MNKKTLGIGLGISMLMAVALNFVSSDASAYQGGTRPCSPSGIPSSSTTYVACASCQTIPGIGVGGDRCRYIQE